MPIELDRGSGETRNVSASGIYFITDVALVKGMPVSFTLRFKQASGGPFMLRGEACVVRLEQLGDKVGVGAAISHYELERIAPQPRGDA